MIGVGYYQRIKPIPIKARGVAHPIEIDIAVNGMVGGIFAV